MELHRKHFGKYPTRFEEAKELINPLPRDQWGNPMRLSHGGADSYIIASDGEDREPNTEDDIRYFSKTDTVVYPETSNVLAIVGIGVFAFTLLSYVFCLLFLNPYVFFNTLLESGRPRRLYVLLFILMGTSPFTWPNLVPMSIGFSKFGKNLKFSPLVIALFIISNISIGFLIYLNKRYAFL
ncbi:MAG: hypothetical protein EOO07_37485 [Chitinophagaceae bacterium]|nr:MAG: hypothetical protein EOO07_37485 [Chitinophagaceae bacterium]